MAHKTLRIRVDSILLKKITHRLIKQIHTLMYKRSLRNLRFSNMPISDDRSASSPVAGTLYQHLDQFSARHDKLWHEIHVVVTVSSKISTWLLIGIKLLVELPLWQEKVSRNRERDRNVNGIRRDTTPSVPVISLLPDPKTLKTDTCKTSINRECSRAQMNCRKCVGDLPSESARSGNGNMTIFPRSATCDTLRPLYFLMNLAEQDNMADTTALILVPSLLTLLAVFEKPGNVLSVLQAQTNLWMRCVCMFIGCLGGAFLAREIFTCKLRLRLRVSNNLDKASQSDGIGGSIDGMPARLWIQRLMLKDFHAQLWYLTAVTIVVTFGCFARVDVPLRFALLS
ncbi:hypothetical protein PsorP6_003667 [Peronosclerospora sorghi]|uniref:Uncharacterized protein n=1 Tax=Peronosclerospora sorghi TaxID=230839 RepID=A0ACC0VL84_9STRA|nr:hypothetical protein PsorP6_003667 [Peronosclerospora sorghi]